MEIKGRGGLADLSSVTNGHVNGMHGNQRVGGQADLSSVTSGNGNGNGTNPGVRAGGQADMEFLAGEVEVGVGWSRWWVLIVLLILVVLGLVIWWIVVITMPRKAHDITARDIIARDISASENLTVAGQTVLSGKSKLRNASIGALFLPPVSLSELNIVLDGSESSITLTNQSGSIVTVVLPSAASNPGLLVLILNETTNAIFHVEPQGADTIEGSTAIAVENSSAFFISVGTTPSGLANWKQLT